MLLWLNLICLWVSFCVYAFQIANPIYKISAKKSVHIILLLSFADIDYRIFSSSTMTLDAHINQYTLLPSYFCFAFCFLEEEKITVCVHIAYSLAKWQKRRTILHIYLFIYINSNYAYEYRILSVEMKEKWLQWWMIG